MDSKTLFNMKTTIIVVLFFCVLGMWVYHPRDLKQENERLYEVCDSLVRVTEKMRTDFDKCYTYKNNIHLVQ